MFFRVVIVDFIEFIENNNNMTAFNKYTIVYAEPWFDGNQSYTLTKYDHVYTDNLPELLNDRKYVDNVSFVFEGWCNEANK